MDLLKGQLKVNEGAYEALKAGATSLLAVGVTEVKGEFDKDDIVQVISPDGEAFAVGRIGFDSNKAQSMLGKKGERPLIHYDYLYIL